jgi:glycine dehydrogenase
MLAALDVASLDELIEQAVPQVIRMEKKLQLRPPRSESEVLAELRELADQNKAFRSFMAWATPTA